MNGGLYCPVNSYLVVGTVVSTVQYISSSYGDGLYWPVYNFIVGMVVRFVLYLALFVMGIGGPDCPVYSYLCHGNVVHTVLFIAIAVV